MGEGGILALFFLPQQEDYSSNIIKWSQIRDQSTIVAFNCECALGVRRKAHSQLGSHGTRQSTATKTKNFWGKNVIFFVAVFVYKLEI